MNGIKWDGKKSNVSVRRGRQLWETMLWRDIEKEMAIRCEDYPFGNQSYFTSIINKWRISISQLGLLKYINNKYCTLNIILPLQFLVGTVLNYFHLSRKNRNLSSKSIFEMCSHFQSLCIIYIFFTHLC